MRIIIIIIIIKVMTPAQDPKQYTGCQILETRSCIPDLFFQILTSRVWLPYPGYQITNTRRWAPWSWLTRSWLPDHGYQILAARSWIPVPGYQILATRSWLSDPGNQILATRSWAAAAAAGAATTWLTLGGAPRSQLSEILGTSLNAPEPLRSETCLGKNLVEPSF